MIGHVSTNMSMYYYYHLICHMVGHLSGHVMRGGFVYHSNSDFDSKHGLNVVVLGIATSTHCEEDSCLISVESGKKALFLNESDKHVWIKFASPSDCHRLHSLKIWEGSTPHQCAMEKPSITVSSLS